MNKIEKVNIIAEICNGILLHNQQIITPELTSAEWDDLLKEASAQGVLPVIIGKLDDIKPTLGKLMEKEQFLNWIGIALQNEQNYNLRLHVMQKLAKMFAEDGIDIMFMKGATLAQLYPKPEWRVFSDIDYYLYGKSEQGIEAMAKRGIRNSAYYHHHTQASMNDVLVENHYDFVERVNHKCDVMLDDALKALAEKEGRLVRAEFLGDDVKNAYLMTPTMSAIFLIRHMSAHFAGETIPLRMLYDWALFLDKYGKNVDWSLVSNLYEQSGMLRFAGIIMRILNLHLGYDCEACPVAGGDENEAHKVWNSIVNPPEPNPYDKSTLRYYMFEARTFFANRWKHEIVYPGESHFLLFFKYVWLVVKKMLGLLK